MKVALIVPYSNSVFRNKPIKDSTQMAGFNELAAYLEHKNIDVKGFDFLYDEMINYSDEIDALRDFQPEVVVVSATICLEDLHFYKKHLSALFVCPPILIGWGIGVLDYKMALKTVKWLDYVIPTLNEIVAYELITEISKNGRAAHVRGVAWRLNQEVKYEKPCSCDLDEVYDVISPTAFISKEDPTQAYIVASRGCWYKRCEFCTIGAASELYDGCGWIPRNIDHVVNNIEELYKCHGVTKIHFMDSEFIGPGARGKMRAQHFASRILEHGIQVRFIIDSRVTNVDEKTFKLLKEAGLAKVFLGAESGCNRTLSVLKKGQTTDEIVAACKTLQKLHVDMRVGSLLADISSTLEDIKESLEFYKANRLINVLEVSGAGSIFSQIHLHSGTKLYTRYRESFDGAPQLLSEIPATYQDSKVQLFIDLAETLHQEVRKKQMAAHTMSENSTKKEWIKPYMLALRNKSLTILLTMIESIQKHNEEPSNVVTGLCSNSMAQELNRFDIYWEKRMREAVV